MKQILIVEDDLAFGTMLQTWLKKKGFDVEKVTNVGAAARWLTEGGADSVNLILSDLRLPDHDGLFLLTWMRKRNIAVPFIVMTHYAEVQNAVLAMKSGAADYIAKPVQPDILLQKINDALQAASVATPVSQAVSAASAPVSASSTNAAASCTTANANASASVPKYLEGKSESSRQLYDYVRLVAPTPMSVLILGASGTGKEYVARRIHELSARKDKPFFALDCGAIPKDVAASEFFGHKKGAFTGADADKRGAFEVANGGTLFLDEVGNLPMEVQQMMLRVLTSKTYHPVGSTEEKIADVRVIAATNENLEEAIKEKRFREDLYYRLCEFTIQLPELGSCKEDILPLAAAFVEEANARTNKRVTTIDEEAKKALLAYPWPGNVRELKHIMQQAVLMSPDGIITEELLMFNHNVSTQPNSLKELKNGIEKEHYEKMLEECDGNVTSTAKSLGISRSTIYRKMKDHGIKRKKK